jgi:sugar/nucleoside kinase (ribokinase family)
LEKRIVVVGELNVDLIVSGLTAFPSPGREILASGMRVVLGSSSAICAAGLARLGAQVGFVGKVGKDYYGDLVIDQLHELGVDTSRVIRDGTVPTGVTISLTSPQDRALITYLGCIPHLRVEDIDLSILGRYHHLHVGSYFLQRGLRPGLLRLFGHARRTGLTVSLDTGCDPQGEWGTNDLPALLEQVDLFLPNETEAQAIAGVEGVEAALRGLAKRARLVVVKLGPSGAMSLHGEQVIHSPAFRVDVVDATGAGDSFNAGFIYAYVIRGDQLAKALSFANACGALSTTGLGGTAVQPTVEQALAFLEEQR